ncbi:MAG TPA: bifunctional UDP-N-acetylglucosamine diphosphorylase/glucosamine-1-phosphate N-acetyltransferase GlmU [Actinomycetota bacterium]|nr:bifunctional UDP-N-acetylglucosamine diphosphorylase/glucosamine-1-phosphate N-acetyltransferase GlmU [Actinomycetota bacterium]
MERQADDVAAIVLAAGEGKRLRSALPKVLHRVAGKPLLAHALAAVAPLGVAQTVVVVSNRRQEIAEALSGYAGDQELDLVVQDPPRGTGDAVRVGLSAVRGDVAKILVTLGDSPLLRTETLRTLLEGHRTSGAAATLLTAQGPPGNDAGRVIRTTTGEVQAIVEVRDATPEELSVSEVNAGFYIFDAAKLRKMIERLEPTNAQGEYYLTDVIGLLRAEGETVAAVPVRWDDTQGVNDRAQLSEVAAVLRRRTAEMWLKEGVTIVDPATTFIDASVTIGHDAVIHPFTFLEGATVVGSGAEVGPQTRVVDSTIQAGANVTFAVVKGSDIGPNASVGPFASLRPGTKLAAGAKLGTFVESKNTFLDEGAKANHLAYLGDAEIGRNSNIGAGTITCNWDGRNKNKTIIEEDVYVSSDTMLVAPVRLGKGSATGAGAVVRDDVPDGALAVGMPARIIEGKGGRLEHEDDPGEDGGKEEDHPDGG